VKEPGTKLRLIKLNYTLKGSINLESFIPNLKRELTYKILKEIKSKEDNKLNFINDLLLKLNTKDKVLVPIDKTNRYMIITLENYRILMFKNLDKNTDKIDMKEVRKFKGEAVEILEKF